MEPITKHLIESVAFDRTIGAGDDDEHIGKHIESLEHRLGRTADLEELTLFRSELRKNLQMMAQP